MVGNTEVEFSANRTSRQEFNLSGRLFQISAMQQGERKRNQETNSDRTRPGAR